MGAWGRPGARRIGGLVGLAMSAWLTAPARGDELAALTRQSALPLAIRDGRIAELTVHVVPFAILARPARCRDRCRRWTVWSRASPPTAS